MFFLKEYKCKKIKEPDICLSRKKILKSQNENLLYLINKHFSWMKKFIKNYSDLSSNFFHLKLSNFLLNTVDSLDKILIFFFSQLFALNKSVILRKIK